MLLFTSLLKSHRISHVLESGRARGQITEIIARWINEFSPSCSFDSIEYDPYSKDVNVAASPLRHLSDYVNLYFGDSNRLLPSMIPYQKRVAVISMVQRVSKL